MSVRAPNLDDRRFQELVDDAKRYVQRRCPEWTDHNVSDPGVTLIEAFAYMVDQLVYRLNQVPDHQYLRYLELLGVERLPPSAAVAPVTFWLSAPQDDLVVIEAGTEVATRRLRHTPAIVFRTEDDLGIQPVSMTEVLTRVAGDEEPYDRMGQIIAEDAFPVFGNPPTPGDLFLVGLDQAAPRCAVRLSIDCRLEGYGVDPEDPPLQWEALCDTGWEACDVDDRTGGFNDPGDVVVHVPAGHEADVIGGRSAGWLRCRVLEPRADQPTYTASPIVYGVSAATVGGTTTAVNGEDVHSEIVGVSAGTPGQRFPLARNPIVRTDEPLAVEVSTDAGWETWSEVDVFAESGPDDPHFRLEPFDGELVFGPAVREADGGIRQYGRVPHPGARIRVPSYRVGGGAEGNVARGEIVTLRSSVPFVHRVENRLPARGGLEAESASNARDRGPLVLGTRDRAVTLEDYAYLALHSSSRVARTKAIEIGEDGEPASDTNPPAGVRVLVIPRVGAFEPSGRFRRDQLLPGQQLRTEIETHLEQRRTVGTRVLVSPARYMGITVVVQARARAGADLSAVEFEALKALYRYFSPLEGGPAGTGWAFGRPVHVGEVYGVLQAVDGIDFVQAARLFPVNINTGERGDAVERIELEPSWVVFSEEHQIRLVEALDTGT